jgi:hypothetical protein
MKPSHEPIETGFRVRLMSPLGSYPANTFATESAALVIAPEACFSIVRLRGEDWSFSEVDSLTPLEIPLLGSILLSVSIGERYIYPYPTDHVLLLETPNNENINDKCISECRDFLLDHVREYEPKRRPAEMIHRPPALGGISYALIPSQDSDKERRANLCHLESAGPILLRGVSSLIKAHMAWEHGELGEAACIFLWICLDAAHSLILQKLRESGVANPNSSDAARYFEEIFGHTTPWEKFFEEDYENRIRAIHPDNRFGPEARPQFLADDFYELNDMLIPFFQFLVSAHATEPDDS